MAEEYPYTGEDIDRVTSGYVNSGVLRMWVSEGRLTPGDRAKSIKGGPRTFHRKTVMKAVLMAELRKHGVGLPACEEWANLFLKTLSTIKNASDDEALNLPMCFAIKPGSGTVFPITANSAVESLAKFLKKYGPTVLVIDIVLLMGSAMAILDAIEPADESEEPEADATGAEDT